MLSPKSLLLSNTYNHTVLQRVETMGKVCKQLLTRTNKDYLVVIIVDALYILPEVFFISILKNSFLGYFFTFEIYDHSSTLSSKVFNTESKSFYDTLGYLRYILVNFKRIDFLMPPF